MTPDDITPEQALASAYLDGDVTPGERARVDAAPELLAMVASMRHVATLVATVPAPAASMRERGVAAALAEFDAVAAGSNVVSLASRRRFSNAVLSAAAAVVLLGVVAISVLSNNSSNEKADSVSLETNTKVADPAAAEDAAGTADQSTGDGEVMVSLAAPIDIENRDQLAALTLPQPPEAGSSPADTTAAGNDVDTQRLESFNVEAIACMSETQEFLADIYYQGMLAIAVRDTVTGVTEAIDSTCTVLASVAP
ncbi:MAG: hypothetical protein ABL953_10355 [Ilumatobacteraceae bacterium]